MSIIALQGTAPFDLTKTPSWCLNAARLYDGTSFLKNMQIRIESGHVAAITPLKEVRNKTLPVWKTPDTVVPGLFDIQINGVAGYMFNNEPSAHALQSMGRALRARGTTSWLPTYVTDVPQGMAQAVAAIQQVFGKDGIVGLHLEGPHISVARRGVHQENLIHPLSEFTLAQIGILRSKHIPVLLTLAPECQEQGAIARLRAMGVVVSIGHTAANPQQILSALDEGATCFTHLFNGMTPMSSRDPGVVGTAIDSDAWCGVIADGYHVHDTMLRLAINARPRADRMVLVSDSMATLGGPDYYQMYGETIRVQNGRLVNASGSLAGAHIDMAQSLRRLIQEVRVPPLVALRMATSNPAELMGLDRYHGHIRVGNKADFVLLDSHWTLQSVI